MAVDTRHASQLHRVQAVNLVKSQGFTLSIEDGLSEESIFCHPHKSDVFIAQDELSGHR